MKVEHYLFVFAILVAVALVKMQSKIANLQVLDSKSVEYNRNIDAACDDAMQSMIEVVDDYDYSVNLDSCAESFFGSLYASFGVLDSQTGQEQLKWYLPCLVVTEHDGFFVYYHSFSSDGNSEKMQWTQKMPYYYAGVVDGKKYVVNFTMTDEVVLQFRGRNFKGDWHSMEEFYENSDGYSDLVELLTALRKEGDERAFMQSEEFFQKVRLSAMQYQIEKKTNYYVNKHNLIAKMYGLNYTFRLPVSSTDVFSRVVSDVSLLAIFQGYPYGKGSEDVYSRFSVSGARILKKHKYWVKGGAGGVLFYHRDSCAEAVGAIKSFDSRQECAVNGAYPCPVCHP